jgi:hypothetical protein
MTLLVDWGKKLAVVVAGTGALWTVLSFLIIQPVLSRELTELRQRVDAVDVVQRKSATQLAYDLLKYKALGGALSTSEFSMLCGHARVLQFAKPGCAQ